MRVLVCAFVLLACGGLPTSMDGGIDGGTCADAKWLAFERHVLSTDFVGEGVAVYDVDKDGHLDIVTVPFWYSGPTFERHEVAAPPPVPLNPATQFGSVYGVFPQDIDHDGCTDILVSPHEVDTAMFWYQNPRSSNGQCGGSGHWTQHNILQSGWQAGTANPVFEDVFGDGTQRLIMAESTSQTLAWWRPPTDPTQTWEPVPIAGPNFPGAIPIFHGIGVGDVNGDNRLDVLHPMAWFEQTMDAKWIKHPFPAELLNAQDNTRTCSHMMALDVDRDGLTDVICARPHDYGLYWWRQVKTDGAETTFVAQTIDNKLLSQMHSLRLDDLDGDGVPEIITGKRYYAHLPPGDPGENDPALLIAWSIRTDSSGVHFDSHIIDCDSGAGAQFAIADLNDDHRPDVIVSNKKGTYYFLQKPK